VEDKEEGAFLMNIGWFSTGRDEAARQLLQAVQESISSGEIKAKISFVFSNREPGESGESDLFFQLVHSYSLPLICLSHKKFKTANSTKDWRIKYDREVISKIEKFSPDLCVLAGYMLIMGEEMCQKYNMINLHPAPPGGPKGSWQEVIWQLIENKASEAGAMMHLVTPKLDKGPAVTYCLFSIMDEPFKKYWEKNDKDKLFHLIRQHELAHEFPLIISTLKAFGERQISIKHGKVVDDKGNFISGYDLSAEVNQAVKARL
jgi:folate-dependent phosphoribosylglycinamide formyltransferase PurN